MVLLQGLKLVVGLGVGVGVKLWGALLEAASDIGVLGHVAGIRVFPGGVLKGADVLVVLRLGHQG